MTFYTSPLSPFLHDGLVGTVRGKTFPILLISLKPTPDFRIIRAWYVLRTFDLRGLRQVEAIVEARREVRSSSSRPWLFKPPSRKCPRPASEYAPCSFSDLFVSVVPYYSPSHTNEIAVSSKLVKRRAVVFLLTRAGTFPVHHFRALRHLPARIRGQLLYRA